MSSWERLAPQSGTAFRLAKGDGLEVRDPRGQQVADLFCVRAEEPSDALSSGRSIDYNDTISFSVGHTLYSHQGHPLLRIEEDSCGTHDFLVTPCSLQMFRMLDPACDYHPSCEENLTRHLSAFGVDARFLATTFNIFMRVPVGPGGKIQVLPPLSRPGDRILFRARCDLFVGLTACSDAGTNGGHCKEIDFRPIPGARLSAIDLEISMS